jgi:hypothetical protein
MYLSSDIVYLLKWDIIGEVIVARLRGTITVLSLPRAVASGLPASGITAYGISGKQLDVGRYNFYLGPVLAVLLPAILAEFAVNAYLFAFCQILAQRLTLVAPENNVKIIRLVNPLIPVFPPPVYGNRKFAHSLS